MVAYQPYVQKTYNIPMLLKFFFFVKIKKDASVETFPNVTLSAVEDQLHFSSFHGV